MTRLRNLGSYDQSRKAFCWDVPEYFNLFRASVGNPAYANRLCLRHLGDGGEVADWSFAQMAAASSKLAGLFDQLDASVDARVGIFLSQCPEVIMGHMACAMSGRIALPLFSLFRGEALAYRLDNSGAEIVICDLENLPHILALRDRLPHLGHILLTDGDHTDAVNMHRSMANLPGSYDVVNSRSDDPCLIIYTSGTTGAPKGALHAQRLVLGHMPAVDMAFEFPKAEDAIFWTPADWAWIGGLYDLLMPALLMGATTISRRFKKFEAQKAFQLMKEQGVTHAFLPPTAVKMMRQDTPSGSPPHRGLQAVISGGEALSGELLDWGEEILQVAINELYGQTECNLILANSGALFQHKQGSVGRIVPGHDLVLLDDEGEIIEAPLVTGQVAVKSPDPVMMLGYWNNPDATKDKFQDGYWLTGDYAHRDEEGYFYFDGRRDDLISVAGYRIGPSEIEDCLLGHPAVGMVAVVGVPAPIKGQAIKAFIVVGDPSVDEAILAQELRQRVRERLAPHEVPRDISFVDVLPMTSTGKIIRAQLRGAHDLPERRA